MDKKEVTFEELYEKASQENRDWIDGKITFLGLDDSGYLYENNNESAEPVQLKKKTFVEFIKSSPQLQYMMGTCVGTMLFWLGALGILQYNYSKPLSQTVDQEQILSSTTLNNTCFSEKGCLVNLREKSNSSSRIVARMDDFSKIESIGNTQDDFINISYDGQEGWIHYSFIIR